jgi:hypothetical protein
LTIITNRKDFIASYSKKLLSTNNLYLDLRENKEKLTVELLELKSKKYNER